MEFKDRLKIAIDSKGVTPYSIGRDTKISKVSVRNYLEGAQPTLDNLYILSEYLGVSVEWLVTGKGEMLKGSPIEAKVNQDSGNIIGNNNRGNIGMGNVVNVSLPETGTQKIIKPDGEVRVVTTESNASASDELKELKTEIAHLKATMAIKDDLIVSLKETIEILKNR